MLGCPDAAIDDDLSGSVDLYAASMGLGCPDAAIDDDGCARIWASSGAMHLTGPASGPPVVSVAGVVRPLAALQDALASATGSLGTQVCVDAVGLAVARSAYSGFGRSGSRSAGGYAQMVRASDGWVALNLPRPSDVDALPALAGAPVTTLDWPAIGARQALHGQGGEGAPVTTLDWPAIEERLAAMTCDDVVGAASLLGLAVSAVGATPRPGMPWLAGRPVAARPRSAQPVVVDLTSLWAGPLAGGLLAEAGCRVLKVESSSRPDGARRGPAGFFDLLNGRKEPVSLDLPAPEAVVELRELIAGADLVLEASRPRVMEQWGIGVRDVVAAGTAWVSITGHGRREPDRNRVAFGDDAAASGGLVVPGDPPMFVGDAIADPIAGLAAASAAADLLARGRAALVDVSLAGAAAWISGQTGTAIDRPVVRDGLGWAVELPGGPVPVRPPAVSGWLTTSPTATS